MRFWEACFQATFEDWGQGSLQLRLGSGDAFGLFNLRVRTEGEPQFGHAAAFGLSVADLDGFLQRALDAGAVDHAGPTAAAGMPRHARFTDPVGNRIVLWQDEG